MNDTLLTVQTQGGTTSIANLDEKQLHYLLVEICAPAETVVEPLPLNLSLVIDCSTSMDGDRLDYVKSTVQMIVKQLAPTDMLSIVSFNDRAEVLVQTTPAEDALSILGPVRRLSASGGTEIYQGLLAGLEEMRKVPFEAHNNHLVLLTDGHTYGDGQTCLEAAKAAAKLGIAFTALGIGVDWNDQFLDDLVAPSGGQVTYIESPEQVHDQLQQRIEGLGAVYARNVRLLTEFEDGVTLNAAFKVAPFAQPLARNGRQCALGNVSYESSLAVLLEMIVDPHQAGSAIEMPIRLVIDVPAQNRKDQVFVAPYSLGVTDKPPDAEPAASVVAAVKALNFYRMNEQAWREFEAGQVVRATTRMRHLTKRLKEAGHTKLADQVDAETRRLANAESLSSEGRKRLRYGTRALVSQTTNPND